MHISSSNLAAQILPPHALSSAAGKRCHRLGIFPSSLHKTLRPTLASRSSSSRADCDRPIFAATAHDYSETLESDRSMELEGKYSEELEVAVKAVHMACLLCRGVQASFLADSNGHVQSKDDDSPVTVADWSVQATVSYILFSSLGPHNVSILAEEEAHHISKPESLPLLTAITDTVNKCLAQSASFGLKPPPGFLTPSNIIEAIGRCTSAGGPTGRFWVLDPIDGTLGFLRGDQYAVALSLIENGVPVVGVLGCPNYPVDKRWLGYSSGYRRIVSLIASGSRDEGCVIYARRGGGGSWMQPLVGQGRELVWPGRASQVLVSRVDDPGLATLCEPVEKGNSSHSFMAGLAHSVGLRNQPLRVYSMVKYAAVARGDAEIFMKFARSGYKEKIWDHAAGVVIIQEAGGVVTDAGGRPLCFSKGKFLEGLDRGIIACSGDRLHDKIIRAVDASWNSSSL
ncbi:PAP-specific phosphatase HAL2-like [Striga hermonthica]|uniref:3'(2'),5'-bisphosphate nucleotidase n=1 Tax=Striga hermonthica TaxID=68872 RepID=A0A9N7RF27_STRHE|nr:PAP-specific phosphatase HAL2-like [Striga hermonthica]